MTATEPRRNMPHGPFPQRWLTAARTVLPRVMHVSRHAAVNLLFPATCGYCRQEMNARDNEPLVCDACRAKLVSDERTFCRRCGAPQPPQARSQADCAQCRGRRFAFDAVHPLGVYAGELRRALIRMKHFHEQALTAALGGLLARVLEQELGEQKPELITAIPKYWLRRAVTGTNSAEVLMHVAAKSLSIPKTDRLLKCRRNTRKQSMLPLPQRFANVRGAFCTSPGYDLGGATVLLIDDIMTTGATADAVARALLKAGARRVTLAVAARAQAPD